MLTVIRYVGSVVLAATLATVFFATGYAVFDSFTEEKEMLLEPLIIGVLAVVVFLVVLRRTLRWSRRHD